MIHTVGPVYRDPQGSALALESAYKSSLQIANDAMLHSIAFPAISCGAYGYPANAAAAIAIDTVKKHHGGLAHIEFVLLDLDVYEAFLSAAERL